MAIPSGWSGALKFFNYVQRARPSLSYLCLNRTDKLYLFSRRCIDQCNMYASYVNADKTAMGEGPGGLNPKKKKVFIPRITLLTENNEMSVVTLEMADKIAKRRNLKLVKILDFDTKTERPTYKLMSTKDFIQEGMIRKKVKKLEKDSSLKPEKIMAVSSKINEHDVQVKIKSIVKLLAKRHEVRFVITSDGNNEKCEEICTQLETVLKDLPVTVNKSKSGGKIKMHLSPKDKKNVADDSEIEAKETKDESPAAVGS